LTKNILKQTIYNIYQSDVNDINNIANISNDLQSNGLLINNDINIQGQLKIYNKDPVSYMSFNAYSNDFTNIIHKWDLYTTTNVFTTNLPETYDLTFVSNNDPQNICNNTTCSSLLQLKGDGSAININGNLTGGKSNGNVNNLLIKTKLVSNINNLILKSLTTPSILIKTNAVINNMAINNLLTSGSFSGNIVNSGDFIVQESASFTQLVSSSFLINNCDLKFLNVTGNNTQQVIINKLNTDYFNCNKIYIKNLILGDKNNTSSVTCNKLSSGNLICSTIYCTQGFIFPRGINFTSSPIIGKWIDKLITPQLLTSFAISYQNILTWSSACDIRIKYNLKKANTNEILSQINKLKLVQYNYIDNKYNNNRNHIGLIAQDVKKIFPEAVNIESDYIQNINKNASYYYYNDNIILLVEYNIYIKINDSLLLFVNKKPKVVKINSFDTNSIGVSKWTSDDNDNDNDNNDNNDIYVYGTKIDDCHKLNQAYFGILGIGCVQELSIQATKAKENNNKLKDIINKQQLLIDKIKHKILTLSKMIL
jgi:hypothetical protein